MTKLELLGIQEIGEALGLSPATVQHWHRDRRIPTFKVGKRIVIERSDFEAWFRSLKAQQGA